MSSGATSAAIRSSSPGSVRWPRRRSSSSEAVSRPEPSNVTTCSSCGQCPTHPLDLRELLGVLTEHQPAAGVLEDVPALLRRIAVVDRRDHPSGAQGTKIDQCPLRTRTSQDRDALARAHAQRDQAARDLAHNLPSAAYESSSQRRSRQKRKAGPSCRAPLRMTICGSVPAPVACSKLRGLLVRSIGTVMAGEDSVQIPDLHHPSGQAAGHPGEPPAPMRKAARRSRSLLRRPRAPNRAAASSGRWRGWWLRGTVAALYGWHVTSRV